MRRIRVADILGDVLLIEWHEEAKQPQTAVRWQ